MNPARQFLHILIKDFRAHALEIGALLLLNAVLAWSATESWTESLSSPGESQIVSVTSVLLVVAWCLLIARVVQGEGLAGRAPSWLTRPYSRPVLLASKLTFVLLCVHVPSFLSQLLIVTGSGVPYSVLQLSLNQLFLAICLSLPAALIAALTTSLKRFVLVAVAVAGIATIIASYTVRRIWPLDGGAGAFYFEATNFLVASELALLALITGSTLACQYMWRSTLRTSIGGVAAAALLGLGTLWIPSWVIQRARGAVVARTTAESTITLRSTAEPRRDTSTSTDVASRIWLPLDIPGNTDALIRHAEAYLRTPDGNEVAIGVNTSWTQGEDPWLGFRVPQALQESSNDSRVTVRLFLELESYDERQTEPIPVDGSYAIIDGGAQCGTSNRVTLSCRTTFGTSTWFVEPDRVLQLRLPVALRFAINPIRTMRMNSSALSGRLAVTSIATSIRQPSRYEKQVVVLENIRLADWRTQ